MVIGHEFVGEIAEVGSNVNDFKPGDIVCGEGHVVCGRCRNCLAGRRHLCAYTSGVGVNRPGAFAEYIALPMTNIWRHAPRRQSDEIAAIFDPFGNAVHTALAFPVLGEDVLITGAGPIGIMAIPVVRHAGARYVVITDLNPYRLDLARKMGAHPRRRSPAKLPLAASPETTRHAAKASTSASKCPATPAAFRDMIANMSHGGKIAMLGIPSPTRCPSTGARSSSTCSPSRGIYGREMYETWYKMTVMLAVRPRHLPGHHPPLQLQGLRTRLRSHANRQLRQSNPRLE